MDIDIKKQGDNPLKTVCFPTSHSCTDGLPAVLLQFGPSQGRAPDVGRSWRSTRMLVVVNNQQILLFDTDHDNSGEVAEVLLN